MEADVKELTQPSGSLWDFQHEHISSSFLLLWPFAWKYGEVLLSHDLVEVWMEILLGSVDEVFC